MAHCNVRAELREIKGFVALEIDEGCAGDYREQLPARGTRYCAFVDPAGGSGLDAMTLAIAHEARPDDRIVILLERNHKLTPGASHLPEPKLWSRSPVPSRFALEVRMPRMSAGAPASRRAPERTLCRPRRADMSELAVRAPRGC